MFRSNAFIAVLGVALVGLLATCSSSPSSPDVDVMNPLRSSGQAGSPTVGVSQNSRDNAKGPHMRPVVFVRSQELYFDSIVTADPLPMRGRFQKLEMGAKGLETDFGPGDRGYVGGRWWEDLNGNGMMDEGDHFFLCPLLPPGRPSP